MQPQNKKISTKMLTIVTQEGIEHRVSERLAHRSPFLHAALEACNTGLSGDDPIPLPLMAARPFRLAMSFLKKDLSSPSRLALIKRPLPSIDLKEALVPEWADIFISQIPFGVELLDLAEAASFLRLNMLEALCCAKIASKIKQGVCSAMFDADSRLSNEDEAKLKAQNEWAWEAPVADVVLCEEDDCSLPLCDVKDDADFIIGVDGAVDASTETDEFYAKGMIAITKDSRIVSQNSTAESFRLLSPLAGKIALFL